MPRVKKIMKASGGAVVDKKNTDQDYLNRENRAKTEFLETPAVKIKSENNQAANQAGTVSENTSKVAQTPLNKINVAGYGDIEFDDEAKRFLTDKINSFSGDDNIKNQFSYLSELYNKGGLSSINEAGLGHGADDPSLTNKRASRRQWWTGNSKDYYRQQAAIQYNKWLQEFAKNKYNKSIEPEKDPVAKDYSLNLKDRVGKANGGWSDQYWGGLSIDNKKGGILSALQEYFNEVSSGGDFNEKTHKGIDANRYNYLRSNKDKILSDFNSLKDLNADNKMDSNEMSNFVKTHGINPFELFGFTAPKTEAQLKEDEINKQKQTEENAKKLLEDISNRKKGAQTKLGLRGDWRWSGDEKEDTNFEDLAKWKFYQNGNLSHELHIKPFSTLIDDYNNAVFYQGHRIPLSNFNDPNLLRNNLAEIGLLDDAASDYGASKLYDHYNAGIQNIINKTPGYSIPEEINNIRNKNEAAYQALKKGAFDVSNELTPEEKAEGKKKYLIRNTNEKQYDKPFISVIIDKDGNLISGTQSLKKGGSINFNKIKKFQYGGASLVLDEEAKQKRAEEINRLAANRDETAMRSVTGEELFDDNYELTGADKADLAALGLDVAGLVSGFVPGGSLVSGATGLGSTLLGAGAQASREGKLSWDNVLSTGASAAMDVASLVPAVGQLAKGFKVAKWLKTGGKWATKLMQSYGYGQAALVGFKLMNEGPSKVTAQEWQTFLGGLKGIQGGIRNKAIKSGTEQVLPDKSTISVKNGNDLEFNMSSKDLKKIVTPEFVNSKKTLSSKMDELAEATSTNLSGKTPDQINALKAEVDGLKNNLSSKLTSSGLDDVTAQSLIDSDLDLSTTGMQGIMNSPKFWNKSSWQSPFVQGAKVNDVSSNARVLKEGDLNLWGRWGRAHAKGAGYGTKAQFQADLANLPSQLDINRLSGEEVKVNKKLERGINTRKKLSEQAIASKEEIKTKTGDSKKLEAESKAKYEERKSKYESNKKIKKELTSKEGEFKSAEADHAAAAAEVTRAKLTGVKGAHLTPSQKAKKTLDKKNSVEKELNDTKSKSAASSKELITSKSEARLARKKYEANKKELEKSKKQIKSTFNRGKIIKDVNKRNAQRLKDLKKSKDDAANALKLEVNETAKNYSASKSNGMNGSKSAKATAASLISAAGIAGGISHGVKKSSDRKEIDKLNTNDLNQNISVLEKALESETSPNEKRRIEEAISVYRSALKRKGAVSSNAKGGILKFQGGGGIEHVGTTVTKTLPDYITEGIKKVVTPSALKFLNTSVTNKQLINKIHELPRPANMIAPTSTKLKNVGIGSSINQSNQITAQENSMAPMYSDAKLNAAMRLSAGVNANQMRNQIGQQIQAQNQQIDNQNAQLFSQDASTRAQMSAQNAAQQRQHDMMLNQYEQGLIRSQGQSRENLLSEWQHKREGIRDKMTSLDLQDAQLKAKEAYQTTADEIKNQFIKQAAGLDLNAYFEKNPLEKTKYMEALDEAKKVYNKDLTTEQRRIYESLGNPVFKSGGSLEEKKELAFQKAELKRVLDKDKAFNKMILEKMKSHEKMLSLLMKNK